MDAPELVDLLHRLHVVGSVQVLLVVRTVLRLVPEEPRVGSHEADHSLPQGSQGLFVVDLMASQLVVELALLESVHPETAMVSGKNNWLPVWLFKRCLP